MRLQSLNDGVGFLRSEREVKGLEAIGLRSEKNLELDDSHVKQLKLERGQPSKLCSGSGWAKNAVCGIFNPCEVGPLKFQS